MGTERDSAVDTCRVHHAEIRRLLDDVGPVEPVSEASITPLLKRLENLVLHHLELEEHVLYPALEETAVPILQRKAARYRTHMLPIGERFIEMCRMWSKPGAISADPSGFVDDWQVASGTLRMRMESEDEDLYALAEAWVKRDK